MLLYIIRHGVPDYEHDCLTELGQKQAAAVADRLAVHGLDEIYCSPLGRARQTAAPTAEKLGLPVHVEDWFSEDRAAAHFWVNYGDGSDGWIYWQDPAKFLGGDNGGRYEDWRQLDCLEGLDPEHCYDAVSAASDEFMERMGYKREGKIYRVVKPNDKRVAIFCHEGFTLTWMPHLLQIPPHIWWSHFVYSHTGINVLSFENHPSGFTVPRILMWSDLSHIYEAGLPLKYNGGTEI